MRWSGARDSIFTSLFVLVCLSRCCSPRASWAGQDGVLVLPHPTPPPHPPLTLPPHLPHYRACLHTHTAHTPTPPPPTCTALHHHTCLHAHTHYCPRTTVLGSTGTGRTVTVRLFGILSVLHFTCLYALHLFIPLHFLPFTFSLPSPFYIRQTGIFLRRARTSRDTYRLQHSLRFQSIRLVFYTDITRERFCFCSLPYPFLGSCAAAGRASTI